MPVFSVDYRLAPKHPYPIPISDSYQAYVWIITQAKTQLGIDVDKWIITGDSAGGHLSISVTMLAILRGFRVPDAIMSSYPVLVIGKTVFKPSHLLALDEELLSQAFMQFALACLLRGNEESNINDINPVISPLIACDALLARFPPIEFLLAENDSLRDHTLEMSIRLMRLGVHTKVHMMREFIHGFHNLDVKIGGVNEYKRSTRHTCDMFRGLYELVKDKEEDEEEQKDQMSE